MGAFFPIPAPPLIAAPMTGTVENAATRDVIVEAAVMVATFVIPNGITALAALMMTTAVTVLSATP